MQQALIESKINRSSHCIESANFMSENGECILSSFYVRCFSLPKYTHALLAAEFEDEISVYNRSPITR